jgi:hypothetical protein
VNLKDCKISGLKSHGCHILLETLLPMAIGEHAHSLINECTKLVREEHNVPLKVKTWRDVPYE